jgi:hypothetical protein
MNSIGTDQDVEVPPSSNDGVNVVGTAVGAIVGGEVGVCVVGASVGVVVGTRTAAGACVGANDGVNVVGTAVGAIVGGEVGVCVVGASVGAVVGTRNAAGANDSYREPETAVVSRWLCPCPVLR